MDIFVFITDLVGKKVRHADGRVAGRLADCVTEGRDQYPRVTSFVARRRGRRLLRVPWGNVTRMDRDGVWLDGAGLPLAPFERAAGEILLVGDVLDKQVVDVHGAKVERVNDIHLLNTERDLRVVHADVGFRGFLRRVGALRLFDAVTSWLFSYTIKEAFIPWRFVQPLTEHVALSPIQLNIAQTRLATLHPADLADIIEELPQPERAAFFKSLDVETAAETLGEMEDEELQVDLLETVGPERAGDIIEEMDPDEAADVLQEFDEGQAEELIEGMEGERAEDLRELMAHDEGTAGAIMTTEYLAVKPTATVASALRALKNVVADVETYNYIHVVDAGGVLEGIFSLREALVTKRATPVKDVMSPRVVTVRDDDRLARVAEAFGKYGFATLPVVDDEGKMRGVITLHDAVAAIYPDFVKD